MKQMSAEIARQKRKVASLEHQEKQLTDNLVNTMRIEKAIQLKYGPSLESQAKQAQGINSQAQLINSVMQSSSTLKPKAKQISQDQSPTAPTQASSKKATSKKAFTGSQKKESAQKIVQKDNPNKKLNSKAQN